MSTVSEPTLRYKDAIREAIAAEMRHDSTVFVLGIDVGKSGGIFGVTRGLYQEFGAERVRDTPISEAAFLTAAVGAAATGSRPIVELMFMDFVGVCFDSLLNQASKLHYMTGGNLRLPIVFRTQIGAGSSSGAQHSQSLEALIAHIPGLKIFIPASVADAYVLMRAAVRDPNPVVYIENRRLYSDKGILRDDNSLPPGNARIVRDGSDVTVIAWSRMVEVALQTADELENEGVSLEVIDVRTLAPLDLQTLERSVLKTGRAVVVHEAVTMFGAGAEIVAQVSERVFTELRGPILRVGAPASPTPFSPPLEEAWIPDRESVAAAVRRALEGPRSERRLESAR